jgi:large subunit ribosomal protein L15
MKLTEIRDNDGAHTRYKRVGRGAGSGKGKTCGRGVKGQKARAGHHAVFGFEGGQMPLHMRMPKRGFNNNFARDFGEVNTGDLQRAINDGRIKAGATLTGAQLADAGLTRLGRDGVRLLGKGEVKAQIHLSVAYATPSAKAAIEKAGGSVTETGVRDRTRMNKNGKPGKRVQRRITAKDNRAARDKDKAERLAAKGISLPAR